VVIAARGNQPALLRRRIGLQVEERVIGVEPPTAPVTDLCVEHGCVMPIRRLMYAP
jgi:hypothetical protein